MFTGVVDVRWCIKCNCSAYVAWGGVVVKALRY
jgi:hypothetical protein